MADKYDRLVCFIVNICAELLRDFFTKLARNDAGASYTTIGAYLTHRKSDVNKLIKLRKIRRDQYMLLYPGLGTADENQWDVTLLVILITELFSGRLQQFDIFLLVGEILQVRNEMRHLPNKNISDVDFDSYWIRLDMAVMTIAKQTYDVAGLSSLQRKVEDAKTNNLPKLGKFLHMWNDEMIKEMHDKLSGVQTNTKQKISMINYQNPGYRNRRIKTTDNILANLQENFKRTMMELSEQYHTCQEVVTIRTRLRDDHYVVVTGSYNSCYTETALAAIKEMEYNYKRCVEMSTSSDWRHIDPEDVDLVICRNPFGNDQFDENKAKGMADMFDSMMLKAKGDCGRKKIDIVIVTDYMVFTECQQYHDHDILENVVKVYDDTTEARSVSSLLGGPIAKEITRNFLKQNTVASGQVDEIVFKKAKGIFKAKKAVVITGPAKSGKTSLAIALASSYDPSHCWFLLDKPNDIDKIDFQHTCLIIIDEFAGKYRYEEHDIYKWYSVFDHLHSAVVAGRINVIVTCEKGKLDRCCQEISQHPLLDNRVELPERDVLVKNEDVRITTEMMLPKEILNMDSRSIKLYEKALREGTDNARDIRVMIVGHYGAGKTTLKKRLFKERVDIKECKSTDGIDVHVGRCKVSLNTKTWLNADGHRKALNRLAKLMHSTHEEEAKTLPEISNYDDSNSDDSMKSVSTEKQKTDDTIRSDLFQLDSFHKQESPGTDVPQALAPNVSASEISHEDSYEEENDDRKDAFLRQKNHLEVFIKEMENGTFKDENHCDLSLWDFAGQSIFYATHPAFLSRRAIYLLVFDMSKQITDIVVDDIWHYDCQGEHKCKISEFIEFWMNSIHEFCSIQEERVPPVILVGTFVDKLKQRSDDPDITFYNLRSSLLGNVANCHLTEEHFSVDNSLDEDENLEKLRQYIVKIASEQSHWGESIPARWITLEDSLIRLKDEQSIKVMHMDKLQEVNRQLPVPITNEEELDLFLKFHHETGTILYYGDDDMKNDILLQPQWLIDAFKSLITAAIFCIRKEEIQKKWHEFDRSAILTQDLILLIWKEEKNSSFLAHKDLILRFMEKLGFVAKPKIVGELTQAEDFFLVPCMLKDKPPADIEEISTSSDPKHFKSTSKLCLTNHEEPDKRFIPSAAFNKLIAACINQWPLAMKNKKYRIYCGGAVFKLENMHFLYIFLYDHVIQIWVSRWSLEGHSPTTSICRAVKDRIKTILKEKVRMQREFLSFVKCPQATLYSNENMVVLQEDDQPSGIICNCQENEHLVSYTDLANCWLAGDKIQTLNIDMDEKPTERDFSRFSRRIGKEYKQLAFQLGLKQPELEQFEIDHKTNTTRDKITALLNMWAQRTHDNATYRNLEIALKESGVDTFRVFKK